MRIIRALIIVFFTSSVYAEIYKCKVNDKISYQGFPCLTDGGEFIIKKDISVEQQKAAVLKLNEELAVIRERKKSAQEAVEKERLIRAEETNADANYKRANQTERQVKALKRQNKIEARRIRNIQPIFIKRRSHRKPLKNEYQRSEAFKPLVP